MTSELHLGPRQVVPKGLPGKHELDHRGVFDADDYRQSQAQTTTATATRSTASLTGRDEGRRTLRPSRSVEMLSRRVMTLFRSLCQHALRSLSISSWKLFVFLRHRGLTSISFQTDASGHKVSKAVVLQKSIDFIQHLSKQKKSQENDLTSLRKEVNIMRP